MNSLNNFVLARAMNLLRISSKPLTQITENDLRLVANLPVKEAPLTPLEDKYLKIIYAKLCVKRK